MGRIFSTAFASPRTQPSINRSKRSGSSRGVHQEKTELSNLFSLFSPFPPVECLSWLECKNLLPMILHADDGPTVFLRFVIKRLRERADFGIGQSHAVCFASPLGQGED